ncbi:pilus assembly protein PilM [Candidatus Woesebacteria bacterium]|nr:MAG: pilus assembly protein PilM [Candidatus Woesebacteria bacterium]
MINKKFVSIYFSSNEVRIIQTTPNKKKVKLSGSFNMPEGIISDRSVKNPDELAEFLRAVWAKNKIKEKSVGIVIPEFSTFTKMIDIPDIEKEDIDEAVRWQSQEFLPWEENETILDWKIIDKNKTGYVILFVAVRKDVLMGYVGAVSAAGLFPIVIETPSLSLLRLSSSGDVGKLVFYGGKNSSIFIVARGEKILGSSVVYSSSEADLYSTVTRMASHYGDVQIQSVEINGPGATASFGKKLMETFNTKVAMLGTKIDGLTNEALGQYLIPISLQFKEPSQPADQYSINLLPEKWVKKYEMEKLKLQTWSLSLVVSYVVWITFFAALSTYLLFGQMITDLKNADTTLRKTDPAKVQLITDIQDINLLTRKTFTINESTVLPQTLLNDIYAVRPEAVTIRHYTIDLEAGEIKLYGISKERQSLILFKQALESNKNFSIVDIPIASLETDRDLDYSMGFNYLPISTKKESAVKTKK